MGIFKELKPNEIQAFKDSAKGLLETGLGSVRDLCIIHPVVRCEMVRIIQESLKEK